MHFTRSQALLPRFHSVIPGGAHTYAKGDDQYPEGMPVFIERGKGCRVWDADGNEFIEYGSGLRSVTLGHAFSAVVDGARRQLERGSNFVRPSPLELECAEALQAIHVVAVASDRDELEQASCDAGLLHDCSDTELRQTLGRSPAAEQPSAPPAVSVSDDASPEQPTPSPIES